MEFPRFKTAAIMWKIWRVESYRNAVQLQRRNDACTRPLPCGTSERSSFLMPIVCMAWMRRSNISTSSTSSTRLPKQALAPAGCASGILQCFAARSCQKREVRELLKTSARVIASVRTKIKFPSLPNRGPSLLPPDCLWRLRSTTRSLQKRRMSTHNHNNT